MSLQDKNMVCFDCKGSYVFSADEQQEYQAKGHTNAPKRCPACREARKAKQLSSGNYKSIQPGFHTERKLFPATCAQCGKSTQVPFEPKEGRPVYCRECYGSVRAAR